MRIDQAEQRTLVQSLLKSQNPDGGWSYKQGCSWAEPTAFVVLALRAAGDSTLTPACDRGVAWMVSQQKTSGGWAPNASVTECTAVSSVVTLALSALIPKPPALSRRLDLAVNWIAKQVYPDDFSLALLLAKVLNVPPAHAPGSVAWYPGTAGWVTPTSLSALVLLRAASETSRPELQQLAARSCSYLLSRRCADQGWNHGGSKTRSEDATSYPETTGLALLTLRAAAIALPPESVSLARKFATHPESIEGLSWLQLALASPLDPIADPPCLPQPRTTRDCALRLITLAARDGRHVFLPPAAQLPPDKGTAA